MNTPEWLEAIKQRAADDQLRWRGDVIPLLQLVEKQREALEIGASEAADCIRGYSLTELTIGREAAQEALNFQPEGVKA